ncbi:MAG: InlB B-repeat-containing protein, partial [Clostridia bacterium]|nr:InlB B-repeat-containing protein [Clostridia bacterium]
ELEFSSYSAPQFDKNTFVWINNYKELYQNTKQMVIDGLLSGNIELLYDNVLYNINYELDLNNKKAHINTTLLEKELDIWLLDNKIYLSFDSFNVCATFDDIKQVLASLNEFIEIDLDETIENLNNEISTEINSYEFDFNTFDLTNYILSLSNNNNAVNVTFSGNEIELLNNLNVLVHTQENKITNVEISKDNIFAKITVDCANVDISAPTNFNEIKNIIPAIDFITELYTNKELTGILTFDYEDISIEAEIQAKLNAEDLYSSQFMLQTNVLNKPLKLVYKNKVLYLTYKDVSLNITLDELQNILTENGLPSSFEEMQDKLNFGELNNILKTDKTFAELKPLENVLDEKTLNLVFGIANLIYENIDNFSFSLDENGVMLALNNSKLNVAYSNSSVAGISLDYNDYNIALSDISFETNITSPENSISYETLKNVYNSVYNYVLNKQFAFNVSAVYNNDVYSADVLLDIQNEAKVKINTIYEGININLVLIGEDIYITISKNGSAYSLKSSLDDIEGILDIASEYFEFEEQYILDLINSYRGYLTAPTQKLNEELDSVTLPAFDIKQILSYLNKDINFDLALIENKNSLTLNASYDEHNIQAVFENQNIKSISYFGNIYNITQISLNAIEFENITAPESENFVEVENLLKLYDNIKVIKSKNVIKGSGSVSFKLLDKPTTITIDYRVTYTDNGLEGYISTELYGTKLNITLLDSTLYLDISGAKINVPLSEINNILMFINTNFNTNFDANLNISSVLSEDLNIVDIIFADIKNFELTSNTLNVKYKDITIDLTFNEVVETIIANYNDLTLELNTSFADSLGLENFNKDEYAPYTSITNLIESSLNTINQKQYNVFADVDVYRNNSKAFDGQITLTADILNDIKIGGVGVLSGTDRYEVYLNYLNDYLYVSYNNLKLCASKSSLKDLITIAVQVLGMDPQTLSPILGQIDGDMELDTSNLNDILPSFDMENPLSILKYIQNFTLTENSFGVVVKGEEINSSVAGDKFITVIITHSNGKLQKIEFKNIYTGVSDTEYFDMTINFNEFTQVLDMKFSKSSYIDISSSANLLKALVNTTKLTDYHITATADVHINAISIINVTKTVNLDIRVKKVEKDLTAMIAITNIPVLAKVNDDKDVASVLEFVSILAGGNTTYSRDLYIYYENNYIYIYREDYKTSGHSIQSKDCVKISPTTFINNIDYYLLEYGIGFGDSIMEEIQKSIEKTRNRAEPMDISNVLKEYYFKNNKHNITINMEEVTANTDLKDMTIGISTKNDASTEYKDYLYKLDFVLNMAFASVVSMDISTNDMELINIGKPVDISRVQNYVNSYNFADNQEMTYSSSWTTKSSSTTYTAKFVSNGGSAISNVNLTAGSNLNLSSKIPTRATIDDGTTRTTYAFAGWFENSNLTGEAYNSTMPRGGITLYAKWIETTRHYYNLNLNSTLVFVDDEHLRILENDVLDIPNLSTQVVDDGITQTTHTFVKWVDENGNQINFNLMPSCDVNLYAVWDVDVKYYHTISFNTNIEGLNQDSISVLEGEALTLPTPKSFVVENTNEDIRYDFAGWFVDSNLNEEFTQNTMPYNDVMLYAKWNSDVAYKLTIIYDDEIILTTKNIKDSFIEIPNAQSDTKAYYDSLKTNETNLTEIDGKYYFKLTETATIYVDYYFSLTINYNKSSEQNINLRLHANEDITSYLKTLENYEVNNQTYSTLFEFEGYSSNLTTMPKQDLSIFAIWEQSNWITVNFNTTIAKPSADVASETVGAQPSISSIKVKLNSNNQYVLNFADYTATTTYKAKKGWSNSDTFTMKIVGWNTSGATNISSIKIGISGFVYSFTPQNRASSYTQKSITLTKNTTLYAVWAIV